MQLTIGISYDGLQELIDELIDDGFHPRSIELNPLDAETLKEDIILNCPNQAADAEQSAGGAIALVQGCVIVANPQVPRAAAWVTGPDLRVRLN